MDDAARISVALDSKASRYGRPDEPLVIAVLCNTSPGVVDLDDVEEALYGALIGRHAWGASPPAPHSVHRPGLWCAEGGNWRRGYIPQVITAENVLVLGIPVCRPRLWSTLEPGVGMPEQPEWLGRMTMTESGPRTAVSQPTSSLFALPSDWPGQS